MNQYVVTSKTSGSGSDVGRFAYDNFIVVWGFMRQEFKLKGFELLVYAVIFGYHKSNCAPFTGSREYLEEWTGGSRTSVENALSSLVDRGLIIKEYMRYGNIKKATYRVNTEKLPTHPMFELENMNRDIVEKMRQHERRVALGLE